MRDTVRPVLLDVTRLVSRSWTARRSTGIDRVCYAYLKHYRYRALAVVQYRGVIRVLDHAMSDRLFEMLLAPSRGFRASFAAFLSRILFARKPAIDLAGLTYLNLSHTDFDLSDHGNWVAREGLRPVYFIHDLIPILQPQLSRPHAVARHMGRVLSALRSAEQIVVSSQTVAVDLHQFAAQMGLPVPQLIVAPIAGEAFVPRPQDLPDTYFLCVGTIEPRKNHAVLIEAWRGLAARLGKNAPKLVIAGQTGPMTGDILGPLSSPALSQHIELKAKCDDRELADLMSNASALLFPSVAEGFGLPLAEALRMGTPAIASDIPVFRELGQGIPTLVAAKDAMAWQDAILHRLENPISAADRRLNAASYVAPTWEEHFRVVEGEIASSGLKTHAHYESSLAA